MSQAACAYSFDQTAQDGASVDPCRVEVGHGDPGGITICAGDMLSDALVWPGRVVMRLIFREDGAQVPPPVHRGQLAHSRQGHAPVCQPSRVAEGDRERIGILREDCTQATKRHAPRRIVMMTADCVPCLFRQMGARNGNGPGRPIQRGRAGRYHCSSEPCWPVMARRTGRTRGGPDRALSASRMISGTGLSWGFAGGRCWVRTNVGLADGFTDRPPSPHSKPLNCRVTAKSRSRDDSVPSRFRAFPSPRSHQVRGGSRIRDLCQAPADGPAPLREPWPPRPTIRAGQAGMLLPVPGRLPSPPEY